MYFLDLFLALLKDILFDLLAMGEATEKNRVQKTRRCEPCCRFDKPKWIGSERRAGLTLGSEKKVAYRYIPRVYMTKHIFHLDFIWTKF